MDQSSLFSDLQQCEPVRLEASGPAADPFRIPDQIAEDSAAAADAVASA